MSESSFRYLMCPPDHYEVDYVINPWMDGNIRKSSRERAVSQWEALFKMIKERAVVDCVAPQVGWPDLVFTANAGLVLGEQVVLSRFMHEERQGEEPYFQEWFEQNGFKVHLLPPEIPFEGAGDALLDRGDGCLWAGYGFRTELESHELIAEWLQVEVLSLRLVDERFYHLDTCFCPLEGGYLLYYPPAFDFYSNQLIERRVPAQKRIVVEESDALEFACNAVNIGLTVIMNRASEGLKRQLEQVGFELLETPLREFLKAGGAAKCLTLRVNEPIVQVAPTRTPLERCIVHLHGHLLSSGLMNKALDLIIDRGGSFQVLDFQLGKERQSLSTAKVRILAPSKELLEDITSQLFVLGVTEPPRAEHDAMLVSVTQAGVAPADFYATSAYPTEVRVEGAWHQAAHQRRNSVLVVAPGEAGPVVVCKLIASLGVGDQVVVGIDGIRAQRSLPQRELRGERGFRSIGKGVSNERRMELAVEQVAWELRRIRDQGGKVVVAAGAALIHSGGQGHLSQLVREGYVQALLGGNAFAACDIELSLFGTSMGVDMQRGFSLLGGHRNSLRAINEIRRCGGVEDAVKEGLLKSGILYECVQHQIPFCLAGAMGDDVTLPETEMDLLTVQRQHTALLEDADLVLALSTASHAMGMVSATKASVKCLTVDINTAVIDRVSTHKEVGSIGLVTDVGLFLNLLLRQLSLLTQPYGKTPTSPA